MPDLRRNPRPSRAAMKHEDHFQLWRMVEGAVTDAFRSHPDYLTQRGAEHAVESVVGTLVGHATETLKGGRFGGS